MAKHIFVTGGVTSSLGKGIFASSLAKLLQSRGYRVTIQKFDPYINVDPGTMNPYEHGECYVTQDGAETDLDLGHYERFLSQNTTQANNVTTGRVYQAVIEKERRGDYLGKTVQIIPHITDEIKRRMLLLSKTGDYDIIITELGGTVGDIESLPYIETVRQLKWELAPEDCLNVHLTLVPYLKAAAELKTKPTQHSVKELQRSGLQPDVLVCRTEHKLTPSIRQKLALFCNVKKEAVIEAIDADTIYDVPLLMEKEELDTVVLEKLNLPNEGRPELKEWREFLHNLKNPQNTVKIGLVGKYVELQDAYKSIHESFIHAGAHNGCKVKVVSIQSETITDENVHETLGKLNGVLVAPGFGSRGVEGKIAAIKYVRENKIPFLGICLGMQCAVIEFARNVIGLEGANSTEMDDQTSHPVIDIMSEQKKVKGKGGTMRLGAYACELSRDSMSYKLYDNTPVIRERHRHRYEFNNKYATDFEKAGMQMVGVNPDTRLVEMIEIQDHPFFVGSQFHPELKSRVTEPHPLFKQLILAAVAQKQNIKASVPSAV